MKPENKIIWVTGASSGIGEALTYQLAVRGNTLIISSENEPELMRVNKNCKDKYGKECFMVVFNLGEGESISKAIDSVVSRYKYVDILFNIGGISQRSLVKDTTAETERKIMEIDYFGAVALSKQLLPYMLERKSGHFIVTSSIAGQFGFPLRSSYSAAKFALRGYFESLRAETKRDGIHVTIVFPGRVKTNISLNALTGDGSGYQKMDEGQAGGVTPEYCAKRIIYAVEKNKREILIGGKELLMVYIRKYFPWLFYRLINKISST